MSVTPAAEYGAKDNDRQVSREMMDATRLRMAEEVEEEEDEDYEDDDEEEEEEVVEVAYRGLFGWVSREKEKGKENEQAKPG